MAQVLETRCGLQATRRQYWIFGVYSVVAIAAAAYGRAQGEGSLNIVPILLLLSPWLLGVALIAFDRPGPLRNWMAPLLLSLFYPIATLWYDAAALSDWARFGHAPPWFLTAALNVTCLGGFAIYLRSLYPRRCPACERRALIPLLRLSKQEKETRKTRWCACCGAKRWRDDRGQWQPESSPTWVDPEKTPEEIPATQCATASGIPRVVGGMKQTHPVSAR